MKAKIILLLLVCFALTSCSKWYYWHKHHNDDHGGGHNDSKQTVEISDTQIIVRFEEGADKEGLRAEFGVTNFETCSCGDPNLELWGIDPANISIEGAISALKGKSAAEGDFQFSFSTPAVPNYETLGGRGQLDTFFASSTFDSDVIDIAILDTGIDYGQPYTQTPFSAPFLYSTLGLSDCPTISGWNFAEGNGEVIDDNGHGTFVTKLITTTLDDRNIGYRILPVRLFDENGEGSYWDVLCGFGYVQKILAEGGHLNIVNASFGGTMEDQLFDEKGLLNTMIQELAAEGVLVVTSAGNETEDTDFGPLKHFPSGYIADNILAVGGHDEGDPPAIHPDSNFGVQSIDLAAPYDGWNIVLASQPDVNLDGTSYSTAYTTALVSDFYLNNGKPGNPVELKVNFLTSGVIEISPALTSEIDEGRYVK